MDGLNIVGVQFRRAGRIYDFLASDLILRVGDDVVVETDRGPSLAKVAMIRFQEKETKNDKELKPILRMASTRDMEEARKLTPEYAAQYARERVEKLALKMTVLQSEVQFGGNKVIIFFSAPGRVDFRDLVKELASGLKARVELKQVGARDEAKLVGGIGICGREFCCSSFLREFVPVSIKMAKNQNLALNPTKVSGGCGRLLCCLTYENDQYTEMRRLLPPRNTLVRVPEENVRGRIVKSDVLNQTVGVETEEGRLIILPLSQVEIIEKSAEREDAEAAKDDWGEDIDFAALSALEDEGQKSGGGRPAQKQQNQQQQQNPQGGQKSDRGDRGDRGRRHDRNKPRGGKGDR
jgi:cell fate regulator YaaT (PSP1 superfamily)